MVYQFWSFPFLLLFLLLFFFLSNGKSDFVASFRYLYEYLPNQVAEVRHDSPESVIMGSSGTEASNNYFSGLYKGQKQRYWTGRRSLNVGSPGPG